MKRIAFAFLFNVSFFAFAVEVRLEEVVLELNSAWRIHQQAKEGNVQLLGFERGEDYIQLYIQPTDTAERNRLVQLGDAKVLNEYVQPMESFLRWRIQETQKGHVNRIIGSAKSAQFEYVVVCRGGNLEKVQRNFREFFSGLRPLSLAKRSLTGPDYTGKKFYIGFGDYLSGYMGNEVKYDIAHTQDVFTQEMGGNYLGTKIHGSQVDEEDLYRKWDELKNEMTDKDMYLQYSSGHGSHSGLMFGPSYHQIRDNALSYPAKEIIIFTMACYSGNLVDSFNQKKSIWQNWLSEGRTLFVMSSSQANETSSTGPMTDEDEPNGPKGSAGSAFGHALWKALIGYADGEVDGIKDHFLSLEEIRDFTIRKTQAVGDHTPAVTGAYHGNLLMVRVPTAEFLSKLSGGTEGLSDFQVMQRIKDLNAEWRLQ